MLMVGKNPGSVFILVAKVVVSFFYEAAILSTRFFSAKLIADGQTQVAPPPSDERETKPESVERDWLGPAIS